MTIPNYRRTKPIKRVMRIGTITYEDRLCQRCMAIIPGNKTCVHCDRKYRQAMESIQRLRERTRNAKGGTQ